MTILILYSDDDWSLATPEHVPTQVEIYDKWGKVCESKGIELVRACTDFFDGKNFTKYWQYKNGNWEKRDTIIVPDVIYDKTRSFDRKTGEILYTSLKKLDEIFRVFRIINYPVFSYLLANKLNQTILFDDYTPNSKYVPPNTIVNNPSGKKVVIKTFYGSGGNQVLITNDKEIPVKYPSLKAEFIDGTEDDSLRDYRIVYLGETPQYALSRIAVKGNLRTNVDLGADIEFIDLSEIPELLKTGTYFLDKLKAFPKKIFSLDFLKDSATGQYYLMELNTKPGLDMFNSAPEIGDKYLANLSDYLLG